MPYDEKLADRIRALLAGENAVSEKKMFGGLAFLLNGNMCVSASRRGGLLARIDPADTDVAVSRPHVSLMKMGGRSMAGRLTVAPGGLKTKSEGTTWADGPSRSQGRCRPRVERGDSGVPQPCGAQPGGAPRAGVARVPRGLETLRGRQPAAARSPRGRALREPRAARGPRAHGGARVPEPDRRMGRPAGERRGRRPRSPRPRRPPRGGRPRRARRVSAAHGGDHRTGARAPSPPRPLGGPHERGEPARACGGPPHAPSNPAGTDSREPPRVSPTTTHPGERLRSALMPPLEQSPAPTAAPSPVSSTHAARTRVIEVAHLRKLYGSTAAVDDVSFEVFEGEIFGLIGPNGAGKTTTMECVEGVRRAD